MGSSARQGLHLPSEGHCYAQSNRASGDKQQRGGVLLYKPPEVGLPSQAAMPWKEASLGRQLPGMQCGQTGGGSCTISWPSPRCSSPALQRRTLQLPDHPWLTPHSRREEHHVCRPMGLVHGPESCLLSSSTSLHNIKVIY